MWIDDTICFECGRPKDEDHHVVPRSLGGKRCLPLCKEHHDLVHGRNLLAGDLSTEGLRRSRERLEAIGRYPEHLKLLEEVRHKVIELHVWDKLSQRAIALKLGLSQSSVSRCLRSAKHPGIPMPTNQPVLFPD